MPWLEVWVHAHNGCIASFLLLEVPIKLPTSRVSFFFPPCQKSTLQVGPGDVWR